jgi:hypothetical protein
MHFGDLKIYCATKINSKVRDLQISWILFPRNVNKEEINRKKLKVKSVDEFRHGYFLNYQFTAHHGD